MLNNYTHIVISGPRTKYLFFQEELDEELLEEFHNGWMYPFFKRFINLIHDILCKKGKTPYYHIGGQEGVDLACGEVLADLSLPYALHILHNLNPSGFHKQVLNKISSKSDVVYTIKGFYNLRNKHILTFPKAFGGELMYFQSSGHGGNTKRCVEIAIDWDIPRTNYWMHWVKYYEVNKENIDYVYYRNVI